MTLTLQLDPPPAGNLRLATSGNRPWITENIVRGKHPSVDLRKKYKTVFIRCIALSLATVCLLGRVLPGLESLPAPFRPNPSVIQLEDIPETRQVRHLPVLFRPAVPLEVEGPEVPEDATIDPTELELERLANTVITLSITALRDFSTKVPFQEEEIFDYGAVETKPRLILQVKPEYPRAALRSGREGTVYVRFVVDRLGKVKNPEAIRGPDIFERSALKAVSQFEFEPAVQDGRAVSVRMVVPLEFRINRGS
jgi:protein TonB